jgi:RimJ/RimL family protein N-acetyltransferase
MNRPSIQLRPHAPQELMAMIESVDAYESLTGLRVAAGLREFLTGGEVSQVWLAMLRSATSADPWTHGFGVIDPDTGMLIGTCGFKGPPDGEGVVEIAYGVAPPLQGRGYATVVAAALIVLARNDPRVRLIRAHTLPQRNASCRVLEKNGFRMSGEVVDPEDGLVWRWERDPVDI